MPWDTGVYATYTSIPDSLGPVGICSLIGINSSIFREQLTPLLAPKYLAELETQIVIDRLDDDPQVALPDVSVTSPEVAAGAPSAVAVAAPAPIQVRGP